MLGGLDFSLAKATRRSNLYKLSKNQRQILEDQKQKSRLEKAKRNEARIAKRLAKQKAKIEKLKEKQIDIE